MSEAAVEIRGLDFAYEPGRPVLRAVDLTVRRGECLGLLGPNGAGKSTLLLHLNGVLRGRGEVRVLGMEMKRANLKEIRRRVGLLFQDPRQQLFLPSLEEDVAFGPLNAGCSEAEARRRVARVLERLGLAAHAGDSPLRLSAGEQKRAALATVLVIRFDHPDAGVCRLLPGGLKLSAGSSNRR